MSTRILENSSKIKLLILIQLGKSRLCCIKRLIRQRKLKQSTKTKPAELNQKFQYRLLLMSKVKKLLKKLQRKPQKRARDPNLSPNLLKSVRSRYYGLPPAFKLLIYIIQVSFIVVVFISYVQNTRLDGISARMQAAEKALVIRQSIFDDVGRLNTKVNLYRNVQAQKTVFSDRVSTINLSLIPQISVYGYSINNEMATLEINTETALTSALLMSRFLEHDNVTQIVLNSAELNSRDGSFDVELDVVFR